MNLKWLINTLIAGTLLLASCMDSEIISTSDTVTTLAERYHQSPGKPQAPVQIKYKILKSRLSGELINIEITIKPEQKADYLELTIKGEKGIELIDLQNPEMTYKKIEKGDQLTQKFSVRPKSEGLHYIHVFSKVLCGNSSKVKVVAIPIRTGNMPVPLKGALPVEVDNSGQKIISMPAEKRD